MGAMLQKKKGSKWRKKEARIKPVVLDYHRRYFKKS